MGGDLKQDTENMKRNDSRQVHEWVFMEGENENHISDSDSFQSAGRSEEEEEEEEEEISSRNSEVSISSSSSSFSSDLVEDASSPSRSSYEPLYELTELMNQLPIK